MPIGIELEKRFGCCATEDMTSIPDRCTMRDRCENNN